MRIILFVTEEKHFVPALVAPLLERHAKWVVRAYVSNNLYSDLPFLLKRVGFLLRNGYPFCIHPGDMYRYVRQMFGPYHPRLRQQGSVAQLIQSFGVHTKQITEIRSEAILNELRMVEPDVFLFCPFGKIARSSFLSIPRYGTFNLHLGKLPQYRGGLSAFWVLRHGDPEHGATVHAVTEKIDGGAILAECRLPVNTNSMKQLMLHTVELSGAMVADSMERVQQGGWSPVDTSGRPENYMFLPGKKDFKEFYARRCQLI